MQQVELVDIDTQSFTVEQEKQDSIDKQAFHHNIDLKTKEYCHMDRTYMAPQNMEYRDIAHTNFHMMGIQKILYKMDGNWMDQLDIEGQVIQYS